ncbi:MAG: glycosyltransferase family 2 protein [Gemmatimonadota bacterium]
MTHRQIFDEHDVVIVHDGRGMPPQHILRLIDACNSEGLSTKTLMLPAGQTPADLRTLAYVVSERPAVLHIRLAHGSLTLDPSLFRGALAPFHPIWNALGIRGANELTVECVKSEARVFVATTWMQLPCAAVAAAYHDAALVFMPSADELAQCPLRPGEQHALTILYQEVLRHALDAILVPTPDQLEAYAMLLGACAGVLPGGPEQVTAELRAFSLAHPRVGRWEERDRFGDALGERVARNASSTATPLLSIAIPTYNRSPLLLHTLSSVCAQAARYGLESLLEIVVSDNASPDETTGMMAVLARNTRIPVRYHRNPENRGVGFNVVNALDLSTADFCCLLGDDDFVIEGGLPSFLDILQRTLRDAPDATLVVFRGAEPTFPVQAPTRVGLDVVAAEFFYHVGNLGLAVVRMAHVRGPLAREDWASLQRFWPQTQLYFLAMAETGAALPALAVPANVVCSPLHLALTRYTGRYLWDEGFFSLYEVALQLAPAMPSWFMPVINGHYLARRFPGIVDQLITKFGTQDSAAQKAETRAAMEHALRVCSGAMDRMGDSGPTLLTAMTTVLLRYAAPDSAAALRELLDAMSGALTTAPELSDAKFTESEADSMAFQSSVLRAIHA